MSNILRELKTKYLESFACNKISVANQTPIISISFDDVPKTALTYGTPILDQFSVKATFYISLGLSFSDSKNFNTESGNAELFLGPDDVVQLKRAGHDIACHTYSHYMLERGSAKCLALDAEKNSRELCILLNQTSIDHFSYPFGQVNFQAKKLLSNIYKTLRSTRPGINKTVIDLNLLRANSFYSIGLDKERIISLIEELKRSGGWLIFYTHGICNEPDAYSCLPSDFHWLISQCKTSGIDILPVSEAYKIITSNI